jgi:hypothetical protein
MRQVAVLKPHIFFFIKMQKIISLIIHISSSLKKICSVCRKINREQKLSLEEILNTAEFHCNLIKDAGEEIQEQEAIITSAVDYIV